MVKWTENGLVVRVANTKPSPFLVSIAEDPGMFDAMHTEGYQPVAVDLGCGNGRNSEYLKSEGGFKVYSYDKHPDYEHANKWNAGETVPHYSNTVDVVLCQFVVMFLTDEEIEHTFAEVTRMLKHRGLAVFQTENVKTGRNIPLRELLTKYAPRQNGWEYAVRTKKAAVIDRIRER